MKQVKIGIIGLGARGVVLLPSIALISGVEIAAVCDAYPERVERYLELCKKHGYTPAIATGDYKKVLEQDLDAVIVSTTWTTHVQIAVDAMRAGKHVGLEVGGATCEQDCWRLVETSQETGKFCMMLENCCYGDSELTVFNMVQQGLFGEIVHATGGYEHDLREQIVTGGERKHGRMVNFLHRNGELYPTHQLGPIAKLMGINRGNRIVSVISAASKARGLHDWARRNRPGTDLAEADWKEGDVVTTILICANGETIILTHGCSLPRPYSRDGRVQGTLGMWMEDKDAIYLEENVPQDGSNPDGEHEWTPMAEYKKQYRHPLWKEYEAKGIEKRGHNDMDYLVLCAFIESVREGNPPIDVYDTAVWMAVTYLSEQSIAMGGAPVPMPDFTCGAWINREAERPSKYALSSVYGELFGDTEEKNENY